MIMLYGIPNCDTLKKARRWLQEHDIAHVFHNYRKDGIDDALLAQFDAMVGWEVLLNKRGTTWRALDDAVKEGIDRDTALALMREHPALIKRPVLINGDTCLVGFDPDAYAKL
ncbi:MAG TPA: ArsC family reductase [Gammaproteobacteria bacterium]|jgi:Spx/MgsR family transcriptional regulator|nr:ArsC family reductase [Gammaproteobacteria bacterium]